MTVKAYITRDPGGHPWPPVHEHEASGVIGLIQRLHEAVDHTPELYAVFVNLQSPSADVAVLSEMGLGVVELKHVFGRLSATNDTWYAGSMQIKAGANAQNPRQQVQRYAGRMRTELAPRIAAWWKLAPPDIHSKLKVQTAVCFTNPQIQIADPIKTSIENDAGRDRQPWENFQLVAPADWTRWVSSLRFGMDQGHAQGFAPFRLKAGQIESLALNYFHCDEWVEIRNLMPSGQPYAFLVLQEQGAVVQPFPLRLIESTLGRDSASCTLVIPKGYARVSRKHARLIRFANDVLLEDLGSSHGTYVDGTRITTFVVLREGQRITLGDPAPADGVCELVFGRSLPAELQANRTVGNVPSEPREG